MINTAIDVFEKYARGGTWWFDRETNELWWSRGIYKLHGLDPDAGPPSIDTALTYYEPESRALVESAIEKAIEAGTGWNLTLQIVRADGAKRFVQAIGMVEPREGREPLIAGAFFDVHAQMRLRAKRERLKQRLIDENARWKLAGENMGLGIVDIDFPTSRYRLSGPMGQWLALTHDDNGDISHDAWLNTIHPEDRAAYQADLDAHRAGERPLHLAEFRLCLPDKGEVWVKQTGRCVRDAAGERLIGTLSDITERRKDQQQVQEAWRRLEQTLRNAPIGIALVSTEGRWLTVNRALCDMVGYSEDELLLLTFQDITHPDDLETDIAHVQDLLAGRKRSYRMEKRYFHKNGNIVDIQLDVSLLRDEMGQPLHFISQIQDITERKRDHLELFEARELAEVTFEAIGEGVIRVDASGRITDANSAAYSLLGMVASDGACTDRVIGHCFGDVVEFFDADREERLADPISEVLETGERVRVPIFTRLRRRDGSSLSIVDSISPIHHEDGSVRGAVFVFQDISDARRMTEELVHQASHDALTGLPNRRGFEEALERAWKRVRTSLLPAFVMYLDLDHFKIVNDTCGHAAGDELLRQVALAFRSMLRETDVLARLGGDEFAAIVLSKDVEGAQIVAEKFIRAAGDLGFTFEGRSYAVGVSVGIAALGTHLASTEAALMHADAALYAAKDSGRGRYHVYQPEHEDDQGTTAAAYLNTAQLLQSGLEQNLFALYLQAIVDADGVRVGYEALLRFEGPNGVVGPDDFLPAAKRLGMMTRIDRWVVTEALNMVEEYDRRGLWPQDCYLSINLSPVSLADPKFHAELVTALDQRQLDVGRIVFEIIESDALFGAHYPQLIQQLRDRGSHVWLDDFASGYNSFDMLKRAAVDGLKIDRSFVLGIEQDPIDRAVIRSIGDVANALKLQVTAEGVETPEVFELLRRAGVDGFQGFLFHRPEPAAAALLQARTQFAPA
ncbi:bifunctional diguanylate cyclase/phosphodiesterase [Salinisphaera aquimarina]|uniref:EAL domain-containing protein n=1 Tax=Salinisphaera aquimarina TaxID=2094031 RepID=A0ABV7EXU2_9GAMM